MNWQGMIGLAIVVIVNLVALVSAYYGLKADNAATAAHLDLSLTTERADRKMEVINLKSTVIDLVNIAELSIKDLARRVTTLEAGQDEWTKSLRERTHELANQVSDLVLKVDRLERPRASAGGPTPAS